MVKLPTIALFLLFGATLINVAVGSLRKVNQRLSKNRFNPSFGVTAKSLYDIYEYITMNAKLATGNVMI